MRQPRTGRNIRLLQTKAIALLAIFLSAGTSLPSLDALLYHQPEPEVQRWHSHVEPAGGCVNHAGHCGLGRTAAGSGAVATLVDGARVEPPTRPSAKRLPSQCPTGVARAVLPQPRAPPALLV